MTEHNTKSTALALGLNSWGAGSFCCPDDAVWFKFTPSTTKYYTIRSDGSLDVMAQLYNSSSALITQNDDGGNGLNFRMVAQLTAGQTYYIKVTTFGAVGAFNIIVSNFVYVESVTINPEYITMSKNSTYNLTANVAPSYATNKNLYWQSGNTNVATVDSNGKVTAVGGGETTICAYSQDGSNKYDCCTVYVHIPVTGLTLSAPSEIAYMNQPFVLSAAVSPYNATNKRIIWCSSDPTIAEVDADGDLITHKPGNVTITAITADGSFSDSVNIRVLFDKITIMKDGNYNKVVFEYGNKEWLCLNKDIIYTETDPYYDEDVVRAHKNFHKNYVWNNFLASDLRVKEYTNEELRLLYGIDPYGVAHYIKKYSEDIIEGTISHKLAYKDQMFEVLFGRPPKYFERTANGGWVETNNKEDLDNNMSESESYFGAYPDRDWVDFFVEAIGFVTDVVATCANLSGNIIAESVANVVGFGMKLTILSCNEKYGDAVQLIIEEIESGIFDPADLIPSPFNEIISFYDSIDGLVDSLKSKPIYYVDIIDYSVAETNYDVRLETEDGTICNLYDVNEAFREYRYNQQQ